MLEKQKVSLRKVSLPPAGTNRSALREHTTMNNYAEYGNLMEHWSNSTADCSFPVGPGIALMFCSVAALLGMNWCFMTCIEPGFYYVWK